MNWTLFLQLFITSVVAVGGWYAAHYFTSKRDQRNKKRELKIQIMIGVYRKFCSLSGGVIDPKVAKEIEEAIADVQLVGSHRQIALVRQFIDDFRKNNQADTDSLINDIRSDLRSEIDLLPSEGNVAWLRFNISNPVPKMTPPNTGG